MLNGERVLVTGAAGFVGANLVRELLSRGASVHALVRRETDRWRLADILPLVQIHEVDLTDADRAKQIVRAIDPQVVFHLAKYRGDPATIDYREAYALNLGATLSLLEASSGSASLRRFVHGGSSLEYDLARSPLQESDATAPVTVHGVTKAAATLLCGHFAARHQVPAVVLRFFTVYGPWEGASRFVPSVMTAALEGRTLRITRPGFAHDWIYVGDVVDACIAAASAPGIVGETLNVATGVKTANEELVALVEQLSGRPIDRDAAVFPERTWDTGEWVADVSKTERLLGWRAPTSLRAGLDRTLRWFEAHLPAYRTSQEAQL